MNDLIVHWNLYADSWIRYIVAFLTSILLSTLFASINKRVRPNQGPLYNAFLLIFYLIIALPVVYVIGIRASTVGFDTHNYYARYYESYGGYVSNLIRASNKIEYGFIFLRWLSYHITGGSPIGAVLPMTLLTIMAVVHSLNVYDRCENIPLAMFVFYTCFGLKMCDQARQMLAVAFVGIAIAYLKKEQKYKFLFWIVCAASFHASAWLGIILITLFGKDTKSEKIKRRIQMAVLGLFLLLFASTSVLQERYGIYFDGLSSGGEIHLGMGLLLDMLPIIPILLKVPQNRLSKKLKKVSLFAVIFRILGYVSFFVMRLYYYPMFIGWLVMASEGENVRQKRINIIAIVICTVYFLVYYVMLLQHNVVPYKTCFEGVYYG